MIVPEHTNSTLDNEFMSAEMTYHHYLIKRCGIYVMPNV